MTLGPYLDWPLEVSIETFAKCNARCTFCPYTTLDRIGTKMPDAMIDRIIEELKGHPGPFVINPFKVNEPFLDKRLIPICRKINAELPQAELQIFTNGSALTEKHMRDVAGLVRVKRLWVSLNASDAQEYKDLMGLDFARTCANLDRLHAMKTAVEFPHQVMVSKVCAPLREMDKDNDFLDFVEDRWPLFMTFLIKRDAWLGQIEKHETGVPDTPCARWLELSICADGKVSLCCMDSANRFSIGDLNIQSISEVYNAPYWRERREKVLSRKAVHPCATCSY